MPPLRLATAALGLLLSVAGCASFQPPETPRDRVASLDTRDRRYNSAGCRLARREAAQHDSRLGERVAVGLAGNLVVPVLGGLVASLPLTLAEERTRKRLNHEVSSACVSDPAGERARRLQLAREREERRRIAREMMRGRR